MLLGGLAAARAAEPATLSNASEPALIIGANGLGIMAYRDLLNGDLMVARCVDAPCTSVTTSVIDSTGDVGRQASIALAADGPVIAYEDTTNLRLKLALCVDPACAAANLVVVDPSLGNSGGGLAVAVGVDGRPIVAYVAGPFAFEGRLKVAHCDNAGCTATTTTDLESSRMSLGLDVAVGGDGLPVISWVSPAGLGSAVAILHCANAACSTASPRQPGSRAVGLGGGRRGPCWDPLPLAPYRPRRLARVRPRERPGFRDADAREDHALRGCGLHRERDAGDRHLRRLPAFAGHRRRQTFLASPHAGGFRVPDVVPLRMSATPSAPALSGHALRTRERRRRSS